ncbi:MAG TPA: hypothetical protein VGF28_11110 [Thermoanaerobaculia bacterium]|jgi:hypothetical protein
MLAEILGENQAMLADVGQEMGEAANAAMRSNDQIFRDIFGEGMDTAFRRPARRERGAGRPLRRELPATPTRLIEEDAIDAELIEDDPRMDGRWDGGTGTVPDVIEAEILGEAADRGAQIMRQTGAAARATAAAARPRTGAVELFAQEVADMRTRNDRFFANQDAAQAVAETRARLDAMMPRSRRKV